MNHELNVQTLLELSNFHVVLEKQGSCENRIGGSTARGDLAADLLRDGAQSALRYLRGLRGHRRLRDAPWHYEDPFGTTTDF